MLTKIIRSAAFALLLAVPSVATAQELGAPPAPQPAPGVLSGTDTSAPTQAPGDSTSVAASDEYVLGPEDTIEVSVVGTGDRTRTRVYSDGAIQANLIGRLLAAGRTPRQLAAEIAKALKAGGFYSDPVVNVEVVGFASRYVTVLGAVGSPGLVPMNRRYRLSEIVARVGGVRDGAADYLVVTSEKGEEKRYPVDKLASGGEANDPLIAPGDKIFAPTADIFYVDGQVKAPGSYPLKMGMTIAQAIARAGGVTESGSAKKVKVTRGAKIVKLAGAEPVLAGDVITVPERLF